MFEALETAASAWRTIVHVSEWSGLSIGLLAAGAALVAFVPIARKPVIAAAVLVMVGYVGLIHGDRVGRADVHAQWADARKAAIEADTQRDAMVEQKLEQSYQPKLAELQKQSAERKARSDAYEQRILAMLAKPAAAKGGPAAGAAAACKLGPRADRVQRRQ
jgi:hypothetical protein